MLWALLSCLAGAATLPGVNLPFTVEAGIWALGEDLPEELVAAGVAPGWSLAAVDDLSFDDPLAVQRAVASGPAREVRLRFDLPDGSDTILVLPRVNLVQGQVVGAAPFPEGFSGPAEGWRTTAEGEVALVDQQGSAWAFEPSEGGWAEAGDLTDDQALPDLLWELSGAAWSLDRGDAITWGSKSWAKEQLAGAARVHGYKDSAGDHLLKPTADGVEIMALRWPRGTPGLPSCSARIPETCLASGKQILDELGSREGATAEALRQLELACTYGVHRACYEAVAVEDTSLHDQVEACVEGGDGGACREVAEGQVALQGDEPTARTVGLLEYSCELAGVGSFGQRLRRLEDAGASCMQLATAYDQREVAEEALLALDRACVLGHAEACERAAGRRADAFAARTVRECEDPELPIAPSCVELGRLLQADEVPAATLDAFGAFLRACSLGATEGCLALGDYVDRWGIENERVAAAEAQLSESCGQGEARACMGLAHLYVRHDPRTEDYGQALVLFDQACRSGLADACVAGAQQRRIGQARKAMAPGAVAMWGSACELNDATGCAGLSERLTKSKKTWSGAYESGNRACELGDAHACTSVGALVGRRHEAWPGEQPQDVYLTRGCDHGDPEGCFRLVEPLSKGEPSEEHYLLLERSCAGEYGDGCAALAGVHLQRDTSFDEEIAARHLQTACDNGQYESCRNLGNMYLRGRGVERDRQRAGELLERFRLNARRRHVRVGVVGGLPNLVGGEAELVVPIPVGPALAVSGSFSQLPKMGSVLVLLEGDSSPNEAPDLQVLVGNARLYLNHQARGLYGALGYSQLTASGGSVKETRQRAGWNGAIGIRNQSKAFYTGLEMGIGQYGVVKLSDFDAEETGQIPLILPTFGFSVGLAFL